MAHFSVFRKNNDNGKTEPDIKSRAQPVVSLKDLLKNRCNLKGALVFYPYHWPDGLKEFIVVTYIKGVMIIKDLFVTPNTVCTETSHHVI